MLTLESAELALRPDNCELGAVLPTFEGDALLPFVENGDSDLGECCICTENRLGLISPFFPCCGQGMCNDCAVAYSAEGKEVCVFCRSPFLTGRDLVERVRSHCIRGEPRAYYCMMSLDMILGHNQTLVPKIEVLQRISALLESGYAEVLMAEGDTCWRSGFLEEGMRHMRRSAELGLVEANFHLGVAYEHGNNGVRRDYTEAAKWYAAGAHKWGECAKGLAVLHFHGNGVQQSYEEAVKWYRVAAQAGDTAAMGSLAECLQSGRGCTKDAVECGKWLHTAAHLGNETARSMCSQSNLDWRRPPPPGFMPQKLSFSERQKLRLTDR